MPFSRRVIEVDLLPWPREKEPGRLPPEGYKFCGCIGCENKSYADHILGDLDEDDDPTCGSLHLEEVYIETEEDR